VSVHPYRQSAPESVADDYRKLRALIARYAPKGKSLPIISSEWGYSSAWQKFDEEKQGKYLPREMLTNLWQEIPVSIWYDWHDDGPDPNEPEHHFGTTHYPTRNGEAEIYEPKPAYIAMKTLARQLQGYSFNKRVFMESTDDCILLFRSTTDSVKLVVWTIEAEHDLKLPGMTGTYVAVSHLGKPLDNVQASGGALTVHLNDTPQYLTPTAAQASLTALADWKRTPLDLFTDDANAGVAMAGAPARLPRSPDAQPITLNCPTRGLKTYSQQSSVQSAHPLLISVLPRTTKDLPVRLRDPASLGVEGRIVLLNVTGLRIGETSRLVQIKPGETEAVVNFPIVSGGSEYSAGVRVTDAKGQPLAELPTLTFDGLPDLAPNGQLDGYKLFTDGDAKVPSEQSLSVGTPLEAAPESGMGVLKITFKTQPGWKFWRVAPTKSELKEIRGEPKALGIWVYGDDGHEMPRMRFADSTGQFFQSAADSLDGKGWRYVTFPMEAATLKSSHWGGRNDGVIHYPIKIDTLFLVDRNSKRPAEGTIYIAGPTLIK
jgi:hypothetical protein